VTTVPGKRGIALEELFETFDAQGNPRGLVARHRVHSLGLWHKSAHVFLFDSWQNLLLQLRAADKDLYPALWDYSVGEHLQPGESYHAGALRGLQEELGVRGVTLQAVGTVRSASFDTPALGLHDRELQQAFRGISDGPIRPNPGEVAAVRRISMTELATWIGRSPEDFTPWLLRDLREFAALLNFRFPSPDPLC